MATSFSLQGDFDVVWNCGGLWAASGWLLASAGLLLCACVPGASTIVSAGAGGKVYIGTFWSTNWEDTGYRTLLVWEDLTLISHASIQTGAVERHSQASR
jgi:hypothetical protein